VADLGRHNLLLPPDFETRWNDADHREGRAQAEGVRHLPHDDRRQKEGAEAHDIHAGHGSSSTGRRHDPAHERQRHRTDHRHAETHHSKSDIGHPTG
jgi:hypothetical protein